MPEVWDLHSSTITAPMLATMYGQMLNAHMRLTWLVSDMTQSELEYRGPAGNLNSTAMLLYHIPSCEGGWLAQARGMEIPAEYTEEGPDGTLPVVTGKTAAELLERYERVLRQWEEYLATLTDADLTRRIPNGPERFATLRWVLWHMAEHCIGHQSQIQWLKQWVRGAR